MINLFSFLFFLVFVLFIPGYVFVGNINTKIEKLFLAPVIGIVGFTLVSFLSGLLNISFLLYLYLLFFWGFFVYKKLYKDFLNFNFRLDTKAITLLVLIIGGVIFQGLGMFKSGRLYDFGIGYWGPLARDGVWHEALVGSILRSIPPENPGFAGEKLTNYHYFYDLLVAGTHILTNINVRDLIYRFYPILFSIIFGLGTYAASLRLFKNKGTGLTAVFLGYFASSFGFIIEIFRSSKLGGESVFWANQPVSMNINPPFAISLILIISLLLLFPHLKKSSTSILALILIASSLVGFKVYAGLIFVGAFFLISIESILVKRDWFYIKLWMITAALSFFVFFSQSPNSSSLVIFKPLWFIDSMMDAVDRVGWSKISIARRAYLENGNWLKYILVQTIGIVIFVVGNLGVRVFGVREALKIWKKQFLKMGPFCLIFWMSLLSFIPPFLFIQKGNSWNTIQFFYYFLFFSTLFAANSIYALYKKGLAGKTLIIFILVVAPFSSVGTFLSWFGEPSAKISTKEIEALDFLRNQKNGVVLKHKFEPGLSLSQEKDPIYTKVDSAYVSAFSAQGVYLEDVEQQIILNTNYQVRLSLLDKLFEAETNDIGRDQLRALGIKYLYLPKVYSVSLKEFGGLRKTFENAEVVVFEVE